MSTDDLTPAGKYRALCRSVQFALTAKEAEQVVIGFEFLDEAGQPNGFYMSYFGMLGDNSIDFTIDALRACGWTGDDLSELPALAESGGLATEVSLVVVHETYQDKTRAKVKFVNRAGGGGKLKLERALEPADLKSFAQRMKSKVRAAGREPGPRASNGAGASRGGPSQRDVPPPGDGDVPFVTCDLGHEPSPVAAVLRRAT